MKKRSSKDSKGGSLHHLTHKLALCPYGCGERRVTMVPEIDVWKFHALDCPAKKHGGIITLLRNVAQLLADGRMDQCVVLLLEAPEDEGPVRSAYCQEGMEEETICLLERPGNSPIDVVGMTEDERVSIRIVTKKEKGPKR